MSTSTLKLLMSITGTLTTKQIQSSSPVGSWEATIPITQLVERYSNISGETNLTWEDLSEILNLLITLWHTILNSSMDGSHGVGWIAAELSHIVHRLESTASQAIDDDHST